MGTDHKPLAWDKLLGSHWESQKPKPTAQQGIRKGEWERGEAGLLCSVHIRAETLPGSTAWLLAKPLPGSLNTVVTKGLCFFLRCGFWKWPPEVWQTTEFLEERGQGGDASLQGGYESRAGCYCVGMVLQQHQWTLSVHLHKTKLQPRAWNQVTELYTPKRDRWRWVLKCCFHSSGVDTVPQTTSPGSSLNSSAWACEVITLPCLLPLLRDVLLTLLPAIFPTLGLLSPLAISFPTEKADLHIYFWPIMEYLTLGALRSMQESPSQALCFVCPALTVLCCAPLHAAESLQGQGSMMTQSPQATHNSNMVPKFPTPLAPASF